MENTPDLQILADNAKRTYTSGDYAGAALAFEQAAAAYLAAGDPLMAAEMRNDQSVALLRARQPQAALEALQNTETLFVEAGDNRRAGMAYANKASALDALKRSQEAVEYYEKAGEALEQAGEGDLRVEVMQLLAMHYLRRFKFYEAILALQSGLAGVKNPTPRQRLMKKILFMRL